MSYYIRLPKEALFFSGKSRYHIEWLILKGFDLLAVSAPLGDEEAYYQDDLAKITPGVLAAVEMTEMTGYDSNYGVGIWERLGVSPPTPQQLPAEINGPVPVAFTAWSRGRNTKAMPVLSIYVTDKAIEAINKIERYYPGTSIGRIARYLCSIALSNWERVAWYRKKALYGLPGRRLGEPFPLSVSRVLAQAYKGVLTPAMVAAAKDSDHLENAILPRYS